MNDRNTHFHSALGTIIPRTEKSCSHILDVEAKQNAAPIGAGEMRVIFKATIDERLYSTCGADMDARVDTSITRTIECVELEVMGKTLRWDVSEIPADKKADFQHEIDLVYDFDDCAIEGTNDVRY